MSDPAMGERERRKRLRWAEDAVAIASVAAEYGFAEDAVRMRLFACRMAPERFRFAQELMDLEALPARSVAS